MSGCLLARVGVRGGVRSTGVGRRWRIALRQRLADGSGGGSGSGSGRTGFGRLTRSLPGGGAGLAPRPVVALVMCALLVAATAAALAGLGTTWRAAPSATPADLSGARWIGVGGSAPASWFRTVVSLDRRPDRATLWIAADQTYQVWVNGRRGPTNRVDTRDAATPSVHSLDIRAGLRVGRNVVAVAVVNADGRPATMIAGLGLRYPDGTATVLGSGPSWSVTADASQTGTSPTGAPAYTVDGPQVLGWPVADPAPARVVAGPAVPQVVLDAPYAADVLGPAGQAGVAAAVLRRTVEVPGRGDRTGWLRVACRTPCSVAVNGIVVDRILDTRPAGAAAAHRPAWLHMVLVGPQLVRGGNEIVVASDGVGSAVYLDGLLTAGSRVVPVSSSDPGWSVSRGAGASVPAHSLGTAVQTWPTGLTRVMDQPLSSARPDSGRLVALAVVAALLGWAVVVFGAARWTGVPRRRLANALAAASLPTLALVGLTGELGRYTAGRSRFPDVVPTAVGLGVLLGLSWVLVVASVVLRTRRGGPTLQQGSGPLPAGGAVRTAPTRVPRRVSTRTVSRSGVALVAASATVVNGLGLRYEALWQDEVVSVIAAQSIARHGLPELPSGLFYFKGELFHALLAAFRVLSTDVTAMRAISLAWFLATVLAFGLLLLPTIVPRRPGVHALATALFCLSPFETVWARDIRMYQQMQFFAVVFVALFLRALRDARRWEVVGSAGALLAMYLSHEESFVALPLVPVLLLLSVRARWWRRPEWLLSYGAAGVVVAVQYAASGVHPVRLGDDLSNRRYVGWDPHQAAFYLERMLSRTADPTGTLALVTTAAVAAAVVSLVRRDRTRSLAAVALMTVLMSMSLLFTAKVDRYLFVSLPLLYALAGAAVADLLDGVQLLAGGLATGTAGAAGNRSSALRHRWSPHPRALGWAVVVPTVAALLLSTGGSVRDFGVAAARATGSTTSYRHNDFQRASAFVRARWQAGDAFITLAPPDIPAYYLGRSPDAIIQTGRNKLLYVIVPGTTAVDTVYGSPVLLDSDDLDGFLASHRRVWMITDTGSYLQGLPPALRTSIGAHFDLLMQGASSAVYVSP